MNNLTLNKIRNVAIAAVIAAVLLTVGVSNSFGTLVGDADIQPSAVLAGDSGGWDGG
ncbi:MAG: hypothetical protein AAF902_20190 [Chloroflexota bacterium]